MAHWLRFESAWGENKVLLKHRPFLYIYQWCVWATTKFVTTLASKVMSWSCLAFWEPAGLSREEWMILISPFCCQASCFCFFVFLGGLLYACSHVLSLGDFNLFCCLQPVVNGLRCPARHSFQFSYMYKLLSSSIDGCYVCNIFLFGWYDWVENSKPSYLLKRGYHQPVTCDIWMFMIEINTHLCMWQKWHIADDGDSKKSHFK